jgi:hypothetical protein
MTYNTTAIAITPSLLLQRRSEVAAPAISAKDRIAMSAEATHYLAVGFLLIGPPAARRRATKRRAKQRWRRSRYLTNYQTPCVGGTSANVQYTTVYRSWLDCRDYARVRSTARTASGSLLPFY